MNQRTTSEIERDLDRTRAEMGETMDVLQERLSPGQLFEEARGYFAGGSGRSMADGAVEFTHNLRRAVRDNPIPFALVTTGLVWLMLARNRRPQYRTYRDYDESERLEGYEDYSDYPGMEESAEEAWPAHYGSGERPLDPAERESGIQPERELRGSVGAASVSEQRAQEAARRAELTSGTAGREDDDRDMADGARDAASDARARAGALAEEAREWAGERAHQARQRMQRAGEDARRAGQSARYRARRAGGGLVHQFEERPLLIGAIGFAVGAMLGAALPITRREDEWLGETRDNLKHRARTELDKAQRVAERTYESARDEAARGAGHAVEHALDEVEGRVRQVGEAVTEAARKEAGRQDLGGFGRTPAPDEPGTPPSEHKPS